jgi:hypothetical protein
MAIQPLYERLCPSEEQRTLTVSKGEMRLYRVLLWLRAMLLK